MAGEAIPTITSNQFSAASLQELFTFQCDDVCFVCDQHIQLDF